jgi:hypothetical protein
MDILMIFWILLVGGISALIFFKKSLSRAASGREPVPVFVRIRPHKPLRGFPPLPR